MAYPPPSSVCHHFRFGLRSQSSAPSSDGAFFLAGGPLSTRRRLIAHRAWQPFRVRVCRTRPRQSYSTPRDDGLSSSLAGFSEIATVLLPGRGLMGVLLRRQTPKASLIPSSEAFFLLPIRNAPAVLAQCWLSLPATQVKALIQLLFLAAETGTADASLLAPRGASR